MAKAESVDVLLWNAMGIRGKCEQFSTLLKTEHVDLALVSNTRLNCQLCVDVSGYKDHQTKNLILRKTGGTAVFIRESLFRSFDIVPSYSDETIQSTIVFHNNIKFAAGVVFLGGGTEGNLLNYIGMWGQPFIILIHFSLFFKNQKDVLVILEKLIKQRKFEYILIPGNKQMILLTNGNSKLINLKGLVKGMKFPPVMFSIDAKKFVKDFTSKKIGDIIVEKKEKNTSLRNSVVKEVIELPKIKVEDHLFNNKEITRQNKMKLACITYLLTSTNIDDNDDELTKILSYLDRKCSPGKEKQQLHQANTINNRLPTNENQKFLKIEKAPINNYISLPSTSSDHEIPKIIQIKTEYTDRKCSSSKEKQQVHQSKTINNRLPKNENQKFLETEKAPINNYIYLPSRDHETPKNIKIKTENTPKRPHSDTIIESQSDTPKRMKSGNRFKSTNMQILLKNCEKIGENPYSVPKKSRNIQITEDIRRSLEEEKNKSLNSPQPSFNSKYFNSLRVKERIFTNNVTLGCYAPYPK